MKSVFIAIVCMFFIFDAQGQNEPTKEDFKLLDNKSLGTIVFSIYAKSEASKFTLKICKNSENCVVTQEFIKSISSDLLTSSIITAVEEHFKNDSIHVTDDEKKQLDKLLETLKTSDFDDLKASKSELENIMYAIDNAKDAYSGELTLQEDIANFKINLPSPAVIKKYFSHLYNKTEEDTTSENTPSTEITTSKTAKKIIYTLKKNTCNHESDLLKLIDATVVFFNNKASMVALNAKLVCNDGTEKDLEFYNNAYSIPLRAFTYYRNAGKIILSKYVLTADLEDGRQIEIHANDIFDYKSYGADKEGNFGFSIANQRLHLESFKPVKVVQRRFFDFFTGVIYSDLMGLNTDTSNSLVNAQASLLIPMNLGNWAKLSLLRQFKVNVNLALNNSFENEERFIGFQDTTKVNHFDLYRKQNLGGMLSLDLLSYESKGWFLTTSLGYNFGFYRTGYQFTKTIDVNADEVTKGQLLSISHGPYINFEFRPQDNFGADIMVSLDELNLNDDDIIDQMNFAEDVLQNDQSNSFLAKHNMVNVSANFYWLTNPSKSDGGVYARLGLSYHTPTEASFPQLLVGYATNLTSFVNRFKQKQGDNYLKGQ